MAIMTFVGLYCAAEPEVYTEGLLRLVPIDRRPRAREVLAALGYNVRWWILGQIFAMICVGLITGIGLWIADAPLALSLALLAAILEIIPSVGPVLWVIPASLVALTGGTTQVVHVLIIYAVTHAVESYILIPLVQRRVVFLPPAVSILAVVLLGLLAGVLGLVVAAPLALVAMLLVKMLYVEDRLGDHSLRVPGEPAH
jgi:predicted PurR-regulated permease PerM